MEKYVALGIDIGGSHITAGLVNLQTQTLMRSSLKRKGINALGTAEAIISEWCSVIEAVLREHPLPDVRIGIAMPGPFDYSEGIALMQGQNKYDGLYGLNVRQLLSRQLGIAASRLKFMNDAACFLQGEVFAGAAKGAQSAVGLTLGTGLGSACCRDGRAEDADLWCSPFHEGMAEDYLSTRWFLRRYRELTGKAASDVKELAGSCPQDRCAVQVFGEFGANLALFLKEFIGREHPGVVVLGGNISRAYDLFAPALTAGLSSFDESVRLKVAILGEEANMIGAASIWYHRAAAPAPEDRCLTGGNPL